MLHVGLSVVHEVQELQEGGASHPSHVEDGGLEGGRGLQGQRGQQTCREKWSAAASWGGYGGSDVTSEESTAGGQDNPVGGDELVIRGDESQVMEQPGPPEVPDGGAPAGGVVVPLEPQHLAGQNISHLAARQ